MTTNIRRDAALMMTLALLSATTACKKAATSASADTVAVVQQIGPENVAIVRADTVRSGPPISGTLVAEREARIRAEVSGAVLETRVEQGQQVAAGTVLARIDDASVRDAVASARSMVTQASVSADQAARELQRAKTLLAAGAIAERDVESAERANLGAQAQLAEARSRLANASKVLGNTIVHAPFSGVVSERSVSAGDVVAPGAAMFTIIDPRRLQLEASVPTSALGEIRIGAPVLFTVNGFGDRTLEGKIIRINPSVDAQTRQVRLLASVPNERGVLVAGLFVQGRIAADKRMAPLVPEKAVDQTSVPSTVLRLRNGKVEKVEVQLGLRDAAAETFEVRSGIAVGDTVLLGAARGISVGTPVVVSAPHDTRATAKN